MAVDTVDPTVNENESVDTAVNSEATSNEKAKPKRKNFLAPVSIPNAEIKAAIDAAAEAAKLSTGRYILQAVADKLGITLPTVVRTRQKKYATEEEAKQARKESMDLRNNKIKANMRMGACIAALIADNRSDDIAAFTQRVMGLTGANKFGEAMDYMKEQFPNVD